MRILRPITLALLLVMAILPRNGALAATPAVTQNITLQAGWNAIYLEVEPLANAPALVFRQLPAGSNVWAWTGKNSPVQFIQDTSEAAIGAPKWLAIFTAASESPLNNLFAITANSAYLIHIPSGRPNQTIQIEGRPTIKPRSWIPDAFNLTGYGFTSTPPTFGEFFTPSNSHKNQAIYRLNNSSGAWELVSNPSATSMVSGEAFWIYCQSGSEYQGPLTVSANNADGLDYGIGVTLLNLTLSNTTSTDKSVSITQLSSSSPVAVAYRSYDSASGKISTPPLSGMPVVTVKAGGSSVVTLAVQRGSFTGAAASVLEVTDGQGSRIRVPVTATSNPTASYPGLWTGSATLTKVSQLTDSGPAPDFASGDAKTTPAALNLNLLLHQDASGQARLLKQVIMMYKDRTLNSDGSTATAGRYVLLTRDALIANFSGVTQRDGAKVGRRMSAVGIDYSPSTDAVFGTDFIDSALKCSGSISSAITCRLVLESSTTATHPNNPFLHHYHPDHDNLASDFSTFKQEVNRVVRDITLTFDGTPRDNPANPPPGWGATVLGGVYTEHIRGLAKGPIRIEGNFTIRLTSNVQTLNE